VTKIAPPRPPRALSPCTLKVRGKVSPVGQYAEIAERHYKRWRPKEYAALKNRSQFFQNLEDEAASQIDQLADSLAGPDLPDESYQDRVGRLNYARFEARSQVFRDVLLPDPEEDAPGMSSEKPEPRSSSGNPEENPLPPDPEDQALAKALADFQEGLAEFNALQMRGSAPKA
jgi:hypothetical protein